MIEVSDTGIGIAPDLLPHVFDLFVQSEVSLDRSQGGLGIGLAVVKSLIELHGGEVRARSAAPGQGSTFELRLPRIAPSASTNSEGTPLSAPPRRVLIVDDNQDAANSLATLLSHLGHETVALYSARQVLEQVGSFKPDVALLDIGLPELHGYELARQLRTRPELAHVRLVALTGYGQPEDRRRALEAGFDDHLVKPVDLTAIHRVLAESGRR